MRRSRLDAELVRRGHARSRAEAAEFIAAGRVLVAGQVATKPSTAVDPAVALLVRDADLDPRWASRGAHKLIGALDAFTDVVVDGRRCLDAGASTGGFTDVLLARGARHVIAVDVGHGQLHWKLRNAPRVTVIEGLNARHLTREMLPGLGDGAAIVTIDVSFISLGLILPPLVDVTTPDADVVALVKPQFEAGRRDAPKGVVRDAAVHARVIEEVTAKAAAIGWSRLAVTPSPIVGAKGNQEFLMHLRHGPRP